MRRMTGWVQDERGFTLPELLVTVLIIGILAAIAIPSFLGQQAKAADASAKELGHAAQIAAETYATDNNGTYANLSLAAIGQYDAAIPVTPTAGRAYVSAVTNASATGYTLTIKPATGAEIFSLTRSNGAMTRTCTPATGINGGCVNGRW
jgi:type IV pilus assembly protein PilA